MFENALKGMKKYKAKKSKGGKNPFMPSGSLERYKKEASPQAMLKMRKPKLW